MKFSHEQLYDFLDHNPMTDEIIDHTRWDVLHLMVFKFEGKFYETFYRVGATENQDTQPWDYDDDPFECREVRAVERTVTVYEKVS